MLKQTFLLWKFGAIPHGHTNISYIFGISLKSVHTTVTIEFLCLNGMLFKQHAVGQKTILLNSVADT